MIRARTKTLTCFLSLVGILAPLCVSETASAQEWLKDRRYQEGAGIKTGDLELHPGLAGEIGYDSNWFLRTNKEGPNIVNGAPTHPVVDAGLLRITPSLTLATMGQQRREGDTAAAEPPTVSFRGGLSATYREFFGPQEIRDQRNVSGAADLRLDVLPGRPIGFGVFGNYERVIQANSALSGSDPDVQFNRDNIGGGAEIITVPGGGTLDWRWGYQFSAALFEDTNGVGFDNLTHQIYTKGRWKFRPRTALLYDGSAQFRNFTQADRLTQEQLHDSTPVRSRLGVNGLITPRFAALVMAGWGASFDRPGSSPTVKQYDSVIGQAEAKFFLTANPNAPEDSNVSLSISSLALGYTRDFAPAYLADYYGSDRGYLKLSWFFAGRALVSLEGGVGAVEYPDIFFTNGTLAHGSFNDLRADGTLFGEYRFTNTLGLNATLRYTANFSDTQLPIESPVGGPTNLVYDMNWRRFEAFLGVRWFL